MLVCAKRGSVSSDPKAIRTVRNSLFRAAPLDQSQSEDTSGANIALSFKQASQDSISPLPLAGEYQSFAQTGVLNSTAAYRGKYLGFKLLDNKGV